MNIENYPLGELVDHRGPMAFIDELMAVDGDQGRCRALVRAGNPFLLDDRLPAWALVEYMAQSVAVFAGYARACKGDEHRHGLLLGCRNLHLADVALMIGSQLDIEVAEIASYEQLGSFSARVSCNGVEAARGTLSVYETEEWPASSSGLDPESAPQTDTGNSGCKE